MVALDEHIHASMNPKPGSDSSMPAPNGIVAANLLLLASYFQDSSYEKLGNQVVNSFAVEIIQHPFLFVSLLAALVLRSFGVKTIVGVGDVALHNLGGFGTTLIKLEGDGWLTKRNPSLAELKAQSGIFVRRKDSWVSMSS